MDVPAGGVQHLADGEAGEVDRPAFVPPEGESPQTDTTDRGSGGYDRCRARYLFCR